MRRNQKRCEMPMKAWIAGVGGVRPMFVPISNCKFGRLGHAIHDIDRSREACFVLLVGSLSNSPQSST